MPDPKLKRAGGFAHHEVVPAEATDRPPMLWFHGFPQSSYMWRYLLSALAASGRGFGDSPLTCRAPRSAKRIRLDRVYPALDPGPAVLVVHDWAATSLCGGRAATPASPRASCSPTPASRSASGTGWRRPCAPRGKARP